MKKTIIIAGISGSLRKGSYNTMLLRAAQELLPEGVQMNILSIADIPLYNGDYDLPIANERPAAVNEFREALAKVDALVVVSPEYNHSLSGVLKNALDWASRGKDSPIAGKPISVMGATPGLWGTARMRSGISPFFEVMNMEPVYNPAVMVAKANEKFNEEGKLTDEFTKTLIRENLQNLKALIELHRR